MERGNSQEGKGKKMTVAEEYKRTKWDKTKIMRKRQNCSVLQHLMMRNL